MELGIIIHYFSIEQCRQDLLETQLEVWLTRLVQLCCRHGLTKLDGLRSGRGTDPARLDSIAWMASRMDGLGDDLYLKQ